MTHQPLPYTGMKKSLVIGIDVGTTLSGVSYGLLEPGKVPRIQPVTRFSGQREENGKSKVRSVVYYNKDGNVIAVGPETDPEVNPMLYEIEDVRRAECFKLRLWPNRLAADKSPQLGKVWPPPAPAEEEDDSDLPRSTEWVGGGKVEGSKGSRGERERSKEEDLQSTPSREVLERQPLNKRKVPRPVTDDFKTPIQVFADFLRYLFKSAKEYIIKVEKHRDPTFTWSAIERNTYFILAHPNGWEGSQQSQMREVAVMAGLVLNESTAADRITFVTEGEANLYFCLDKNPELRQERGGLLVVDCGGGTIDLSAYSQTEKGCFKEIVSPNCLRQGSIFVTSRARDYFKGKFKDSKFGSDVVIETMARAFDKPEGVKCIFRYPNRPYFVKFGGLRDNDQECGVSGGKFKVEGAQMAKFFEPAIQGITNGIENKCKNTKDGVPIKHILLVGGFGRSQYLYENLSDHFNNSGIVILRPDVTHLNKAVADGAVSWYLDRCVSTHPCGIMALDPTHLDHLNRESASWTTADSAGNPGQAACPKQSFPLRRPRPSLQNIRACNIGHKLPGPTQAVNRRRERPTTAGSSWPALMRVNHRQERRDTGAESYGSSRQGHTERQKAGLSRLDYNRGHSFEETTRTGDRKLGDGHRTSMGKNRHTNVRGEQLPKRSPSTSKPDMNFVVKELVRMLNTQIEQTSSDSVSYRESPMSSEELEDVFDELTGYVESSLCNELRGKSNNPNLGPDPLITQTAPRSVLAKVCCYIIDKRIPPSDGAAPPRTYHDMMDAYQADVDQCLGSSGSFLNHNVPERGFGNIARGQH